MLTDPILMKLHFIAIVLLFFDVVVSGGVLDSNSMVLDDCLAIHCLIRKYFHAYLSRVENVKDHIGHFKSGYKLHLFGGGDAVLGGYDFEEFEYIILCDGGMYIGEYQLDKE
jgi:hypothetical protein